MQNSLRGYRRSAQSIRACTKVVKQCPALLAATHCDIQGMRIHILDARLGIGVKAAGLRRDPATSHVHSCCPRELGSSMRAPVALATEVGALI